MAAAVIVILLVITLFLIIKKKSATEAMELEPADSESFDKRRDYVKEGNDINDSVL